MRWAIRSLHRHGKHHSEVAGGLPGVGLSRHSLLRHLCNFTLCKARVLATKHRCRNTFRVLRGFLTKHLKGNHLPISPSPSDFYGQKPTDHAQRRQGILFARHFCYLHATSIWRRRLRVIRLQEEIDKKQVRKIKLDYLAEKVNIDHLLCTLPTISSAAFNSLDNQYRSMYLPNTRVEVLREISE